MNAKDTGGRYVIKVLYEKRYMEMKKKILVKIGIAIIVIIFAIAVGIWSQKKRDWYDSFESYGTLNIMEGLPNEGITSNDFSDIMYLDSVKDFQIKGQFTIRKGEVKVVISLNGELLFEKDLNSEVGTFESDVYTDKKGEIQIDVIIPDDVDGEYLMTTYTRETNWNRLIRRIKDE